MNEAPGFPTPGRSQAAPADAAAHSQAETQPFAFCQNCGRSLTEDTARVVGASVYCELCLEARLAGAPSQPPPPGGAAPYPGAGYTPDPYAAAWVPGTPGAPNPGLATLLGFIPGVGAMYNEQYAKGIVHLIVFVLLVTVSDSIGIFGLFVAGWEFYMAIDANHTARARRDGLPLPNPFGLNDIGERLGFGKAWPGNPGAASSAQEAARSAAREAAQAARDAAAYAAQASGRATAARPPYTSANPYGPGQTQTQASGWAAGQSANWSQTYTGAAVPPIAGYPGDVPPPAVTPLSRFPAGAIWLIGLGSIFLLATTGLFDSIHPHFVFGLILIGLGAWVFVRRMSESGLSWHSDGSSGYNYRVFRALRVSTWLVAIGLWLMLDSFRWVHLHHTWPLLLIVAGVMALLERVFLNASQAVPYSTEPPPEPPPSAMPPFHGDWSGAPESATYQPPPSTKGGV